MPMQAMMENMSQQHRQERLLIETARHRIEGTITLSRDGYRSRVSDQLNATERDFISLTDATVELIDSPGNGTHHPFLSVARSQIVIAIPQNPQEPPGPPALQSV
jgi:hypothetical protein